VSRNGNTQDFPVVVVHSWATGFFVVAMGLTVVVSILVVVVVFKTVVVGFGVGGFVGAGEGVDGEGGG